MTKMRNIVLRAGIEPTSLAFWGSMLPLHHVGSLISPLYPWLPVYTAPCLRGQWPTTLVHLESFNAYNYIQTMALHIHTQGRFNNHTACSLYRIMVTAISVVGVMKMGNIGPRAWLEFRSLAFRASVLLHHIGFPDITSIPTPTCLGNSFPQRSVQTTTLLLLIIIIIEFPLYSYVILMLIYHIYNYLAYCSVTMLVISPIGILQ